LSLGVKYYTETKVLDVKEIFDKVCVTFEDGHLVGYDAVVMATNAFTPLFYPNFKEKIEPFRGQIVVSKPFRGPIEPFSFSADHGYIYGQLLKDNRLLIGGWRNNSSADSHTYELGTVEDINKGLMEFVKSYILCDANEKVEWEYCWSGIMGASHNGMPIVGQTSSPRVFSCAGFTGYGFSFAFGCGKLISDIISGNEIPDVAYKFRP